MLNNPDPVAKKALPHIFLDNVVAAYERTNLPNSRRHLIDAWPRYLMIDGRYGHEKAGTLSQVRRCISCKLVMRAAEVFGAGK